MDVRNALQIDAGDRLEFVQVEPGRFELIAATQSIQSIKGIFGKPTRNAFIEETNRAIAARGLSAR